ncbi:HTH-type transcriptional regulator VirS [compost metagenome]
MFLLLPSGRCSIEKVGEHLGLVPRTLQRRLTDQGQSFSALMNDIRKQQASRHVADASRSLGEVAQLLGFGAPSSFSRWYQLQFGVSAKESRAQALAAQRRPGAA